MLICLLRRYHRITYYYWNSLDRWRTDHPRTTQISLSASLISKHISLTHNLDKVTFKLWDLSYSKTNVLAPDDIMIHSLWLVGWTLGSGLPERYLSLHFESLERVCILLPNPYDIYMFPFILLTSTCLKFSFLMGVMSVKISVTRVEASSSDIPVSGHVEISCMPSSVLWV